jgi:hypothetical protein
MINPGSGFGVRGSGFSFRVLVQGSLVHGSGFRVQDQGSEFSGSGFRVQGFEFRVPGSGFQVPGSGSGFTVRALMFAMKEKPEPGTLN